MVLVYNLVFGLEFLINVYWLNEWNFNVLMDRIFFEILFLTKTDKIGLC